MLHWITSFTTRLSAVATTALTAAERTILTRVRNLVRRALLPYQVYFSSLPDPVDMAIWFERIVGADELEQDY